MKRDRQSWADILESHGASVQGVNLKALVSETPKQTKAASGKAKQVELALPPTSNNLFINVQGRGRVPSPKYREWKAIAQLAFARMQPASVFPVAVHITVCGGKGFRKGSDICNREKGILDAMVEAGVLPDDSWEYVQEVVISYRPAASKTDIAKAIVRYDPLTATVQ